MRASLRLAPLLVVLAVAAGCTTATPGTRSGVAVPTVLVLANTDVNDLGGVPGANYFVDRVEQLSDGALQVKVESWWRDGDEVQMLRDVIAGDADLGWSGTRSLDQVGVTSLTALHAPFLIDSYNAQGSVLADPAIQDQLDDLAPAGLTGLALLADELRFPVGITRPLLAPADYHDARFGVGPGIQTEGIEQLGADPSAEPIGPSMDGFESMLWTYNVNPFAAYAPYLTLNTPLWPRSVVLVANPDTLDALTDKERAWVQTAAADAAQWSLEHARDRESDEISEACTHHAKVALATPGQREALHAAVQPVYDRLAEGPDTADVLRRIEDLVAAAPADEPAPIPDGCLLTADDLAPASPSPDVTGPGDSGGLPEGVYRVEITREILLAGGSDLAGVEENAGVFTWTLHQGRWSYTLKPSGRHPFNTTCAGYYTVDGHTMTAVTTTLPAVGICGPPIWTATWTYVDDTLTWTNVSIPDFAAVFAGPGWRKID